MSSSTIRICSTVHQALKEVAAQTGQSLQDALEQAVEDRRRTIYLEGVVADYAALNPKARLDFEKETAAWDATNLDGLEER